MKNLIFLDIDGPLLPTSFVAYLEAVRRLSGESVLAGDAYGSFFAPHCVFALQRLVAVTGAGLVISSQWRERHELGYFQRMWAERGYPGAVVGLTPQLETLTAVDRRGQEIAAYLVANPDVGAYVIIDDMDLVGFLPDQLHRLVVVDGFIGLSTSDVLTANALLITR
jgi:hypothetical protein